MAVQPRWWLGAQLLDDASRCLVARHGAGGDLTAELTGLLVGDLVTSGTEGCVSTGDRALDLGVGACRRGLALLRGAGPDKGVQVGDVAREGSVSYRANAPVGPGDLEGFRGLRAPEGALRKSRMRGTITGVNRAP